MSHVDERAAARNSLAPTEPIQLRFNAKGGTFLIIYNAQRRDIHIYININILGLIYII
jgi:hypothetical protein